MTLRRILARARIIQIVAVELWRPISQYLDETASVDVVFCKVFRNVRDSVAIQSRINHGGGIVKG
jgi:hypothetical protein